MKNGAIGLSFRFTPTSTPLSDAFKCNPGMALKLLEASFVSQTAVSLILTFRNRSHCLHEAIASAQAQAYANFELILWDDGSTDCSREIAGLPYDFDRQWLLS